MTEQAPRAGPSAGVGTLPRVVEVIVAVLAEDTPSVPGVEELDELLTHAPSLALVELLVRLEEAIEIRVPAEEVTSENFRSVTALVSLVQRCADHPLRP